MANTTTTNKPAFTLRDGSLKATIWRNETEKGAFFRVNFTRGYQDDAGNWNDSDSFSGSELLRLARLATQAYDKTNELRQAERDEVENGKAA